MAAGEYTVRAAAQTVATAITILEVAAPATAVLEILRVWVGQSSVTASTAARIQILRKTGTITGSATPPSPVRLRPGNAAAGATVKWIATGEGTDGDVLVEEGFNYVNGFLWIPTPDDRIIVAPSGMIALKFPAAPTSAVWTFGMNFREIG